jgi:hypothetical protein
MMGKFAAVLGPLLTGVVAKLTGDPRLSILSILLLFVWVARAAGLRGPAGGSGNRSRLRLASEAGPGYYPPSPPPQLEPAHPLPDGIHDGIGTLLDLSYLLAREAECFGKLRPTIVSERQKYSFPPRVTRR